ncbi:unannotated protein [freshwater metagenome]|uniref:Unannotated protein n=1 Tax=freshwater metagenome TaxID=449393 RepID=A0A6J6X691_9ZZZZ
MLARGVGCADSITAVFDGNFSSEHRGKAQRTGRFGETHNAVETVVIGQRQSVQLESSCFDGQLFRIASSIKKTKTRVGVEFSVAGHQSNTPASHHWARSA